jgi:MFS family permease
MGYMFAAYSIAVIIASPMIGKLITIYGRLSLMKVGIITMGVSMILFGCLNYIENT